MYNALFIEDNPQLTFFFKEVINKNSDIFNFDYASDLKSGLELLNKNFYYLVVLDLMLPDSEGEATILAMKESTKHTAIVVLTANEDKDMEDFALKHGIEDYINKDEYDAKIFFHSCKMAVKRKLAAINNEVLAVKDKLTELLNTLETVNL